MESEKSVDAGISRDYETLLLPDDRREKGPEEEEYVVAASINSAYPPFRIPVSSIFGLYRVMGTLDIYTTL